MNENSGLLEADNVTKEFNRSQSIIDTMLRRSQEPVRAVDDVSLSLSKNEIKGVIGESGCGKTTLLKMFGRLLPPSLGDISYRGQDIFEMNRSERLNFHSDVQVIFQDPFNSLNPRMTVKEILKESLDIHSFDNQSERIHEVLERVELNPPARFLDQTPPALSGGEKQRVSIARALIVEPSVLLADEPVSMLDVSTQASILKLLSTLSSDLEISILYISHDISTVSYLCDNINVMYLGRIVEKGPTNAVIENPKHPYTNELIKAVPVPDPHSSRIRTQLEGATPDPIGLGEGCRFRDRCPSIIPPKNMDISQKEFRVIMSLKQLISSRDFDTDQLPSESFHEDILKGSNSDTESRIINELSSVDLTEHHRRAVEEALRELAIENWESAADILSDYKSVCEKTPRFYTNGKVQGVACHLYKDSNNCSQSSNFALDPSTTDNAAVPGENS